MKMKTKRNYPVYWCIQITPEAMKPILDQIAPETITHLVMQQAFHVTMLFNRQPPTEDTIQQYNALVGQPIELVVDGYVIDAKGCAATVVKPFTHSELCTNECPHISLGNATGTKPVYNGALCLRSTMANARDITHIKLAKPVHIMGTFRGA